ncbi:MAG: hypothetical protein QOJ07_1744 [Thermoleophilaceae bacterium]|jgi:hypothetical protein|nr:hypothetical protein [Thermoleophilaceae bacterium]
MGWAFFFMMVILKIPLGALIYIVWRAIKDVPEPAGEGGEDRDVRRRDPRHPRPEHPRKPRRGGPHALPQPTPPKRIRALGKRLERSHG